MANDAKNWVVTTSGDRPLHEVASDLKKSGFHVDQVLQEIGLITGKGADAAAHKARKVKGVTDVSANHEISIGPPDSSDPV